MKLSGLRRSSDLKILSNGIIVLPDPDFTSIAACNPETGQYYVVDGKRWSPEFTAPAQKYIKAGVLPPLQSNRIRIVTMEEISGLYTEADLTWAETTADSDRTIQKLNHILDEAAKARASDLKFYQRSSKTTIRVKIAGREFSIGRPLTVSEGDNMLSLLFDRRDEGGGDTSNVIMAFQSFSITPGNGFRLPEGVVKLRGQKGFHETANGIAQHMVLRLFYSDRAQQETATLASLGFDEDVFASLSNSRKSLKGAVIIGGATGDGKSTTLMRCLSEQYREHDGHISIVTIEDPVEYKMNADGIVQIPIFSAGSPEERKTSYRKALMHFVRINPDVGCISEIRDHEAAKEVLQFVDTGHQVWTTIHVNSANGILFRLIDMGIPPTELAKPDTISILMKQTLTPVLCSRCSLKFDDVEARVRLAGSPGIDDENLRRILAEDIDRVRFRNRAGCSTCLTGAHGDLGQQAWVGYERQVAVAETIVPDEEYLMRVRAEDMLGAKRHWLTDREEGGLGGLTISQKLEALVRKGQVDPHDAIRKGWTARVPEEQPAVRGNGRDLKILSGSEKRPVLASLGPQGMMARV